MKSNGPRAKTINSGAILQPRVVSRPPFSKPVRSHAGSRVLRLDYESFCRIPGSLLVFQVAAQLALEMEDESPSRLSPSYMATNDNQEQGRERHNSAVPHATRWKTLTGEVYSAHASLVLALQRG